MKPDRLDRVRQILFGEFRVSVGKTLPMFVMGKKILIGRGYKVLGRQRISVVRPGARITFGLRFYGFLRGATPGIVRVRGQLIVEGAVAVAGGNRWDIGPRAVVTIGDGTYFSPNGLMVVSDGLTLGSSCAVGWGVQFLDDDFHSVRIPGQVGREGTSVPIKIGDRVWIGSNSMVFKGVSIAAGCVVAGGSVVTKSFSEPNCLIAGVPARIVRRGIEWS